MTFDSRIVPKQTVGPSENGFGFIFEGRIIKYKTRDEAFIAANCLGLDPYFQHIVAPIHVVSPK